MVTVDGCKNLMEVTIGTIVPFVKVERYLFLNGYFFIFGTICQLVVGKSTTGFIENCKKKVRRG